MEGRKKSLDQLLEQGLSERSHQEEQVEVTYELTDHVCEQRGHRLEPLQNRDQLEEETMGSIQIEKKVMRDIILLSIVIICYCSGFSALQSLQSSVLPRIGLPCLSVMYFMSTVSCLLAPNIEQKLDVKWILATMALFEIFFIVTFHLYHPIAFFISTIFLGLCNGPLVRGQMAYLAHNISKVSYITVTMRNKIQQRFLKLFFVISKSYFFWGHFLSSIIMEFLDTTDYSANNQVNTTEMYVVTVVQHTELCYQRLCQNGIFLTDLNPEDQIPSNPPNMTKYFVYVFTPCIAIGAVIVIIFFDKIEAMLEQDPLERPLIYHTARQIRLIVVDRNVRLAIPMLVFVGIEQAYIFGDFTRAYIKCALGVESIAFTMLCFGGAHTMGCVVVQLFFQHFQRPVILGAGLVCQAGLLMVLWLWTPVRDDSAVFYVVAGGWGLCNAVWDTLATTFLATTYPDDWQVPFCTFYQLQWLGKACFFGISPFLCAEVKILIMAVFLVVSIIPYTVLEFRLHQKSRSQNRTEML